MADLEGVLGATPHAPISDGPLPGPSRPRGRPPGSSSGPTGLPFKSLIDPLQLATDPELEQAISDILLGLVERPRELKSYEPKRLTARHIACIFMRISGLSETEIARITGYTRSQVCIILKHPDSQFLMLKALTKSGTTASVDIKARLDKGTPMMLDVIEEIALETNEEGLPKNRAETRLKAAFGWIDRAGHTPTHKIEEHRDVRVTVEGTHAALLSQAIQEAQNIEDADYVIVGGASEGPGDPASGDVQPPASATGPSDIEVLPLLPSPKEGVA